MNIKELNVGNYVNVVIGGKTFPGKITDVLGSRAACNIDLTNRVNHITQENIQRDVSVIDGMNPMPLTDALLLKCGFRTDKSNTNPTLLLLNIDNNIVFESNGSVVMVLREGNNICNNINSLHKLQNLYFNLVGEELPISI